MAIQRAPLFFIGLLPDEHVQREVTDFKKECSELFGASHALSSPPHITLFPPFAWKEENLKNLNDALSIFANKQDSFEVVLQNFNCFAPRVIFVDIVRNPKLKQLHAGLCEHLKNHLELVVDKRGNRFHAHMTIAHRDLTTEVFAAAWDHFSSKRYRRVFQTNGITLLQHRLKKWEILQEHFFNYH